MTRTFCLNTSFRRILYLINQTVMRPWNTLWPLETYCALVLSPRMETPVYRGSFLLNNSKKWWPWMGWVVSISNLVARLFNTSINCGTFNRWFEVSFYCWKGSSGRLRSVWLCLLFNNTSSGRIHLRKIFNKIVSNRLLSV